MAGQLREAVAELARTEYVSCWQHAELCWCRAAPRGVADMKVQGDGPFLAQAAGDWQAAAAGWQALRVRVPHPAQALAGADDEGPLREALEICRELGAVPLARHIATGCAGSASGTSADRQPISSRGSGRSHRPRAGGAHLLADGLRDADIAERLVVSPRTVHHHVSAIMGKLDAGTRSVAVAAAARLGLLTLEDR